MTAAGGWDRVEQHVTAMAGFAYGVIGADMYTFADRGPVYLLARFTPPRVPESGWLLAQPSRLLNARYAIAPFTGRDGDPSALARWRDGRARLAVRWVHGPGGQGKTRLAEHFAGECVSAGWRVVVASQGAGAVLPPPGSQDLRLDGAPGCC